MLPVEDNSQHSSDQGNANNQQHSKDGQNGGNSNNDTNKDSYDGNYSSYYSSKKASGLQEYLSHGGPYSDSDWDTNGRDNRNNKENRNKKMPREPFTVGAAVNTRKADGDQNPSFVFEVACRLAPWPPPEPPPFSPKAEDTETILKASC